MTTLFSEFVANNQPIFNSLVSKLEARTGSTLLIPTSCEKSATQAAQLRIRGNEAYGSKRLKEALKYYSESISVAPVGSEELALAFGNRSAVFFSCYRKYELSLLDANRALKGNCPLSLIEKLQKRKTDCWARIQMENKMKSASAKVSLSVDRKSELNPMEKKIFHVNKLSFDDSDLLIDFNSLEDPVWRTKFDNQFLPNVSSKVKLATSSKWGRHWVATKDIAAGEVLSIEKFLLMMSAESLFEHCSHCSMWCEALIPCLTCSKQMYCSERCRQEAYDSYHRVECKIGLLGYLPYHETYIALRIFLDGTKQGDVLNDLIKDPEVYARLEGKWNCVDKPYPDDYLAVLNLNWKDDGPKYLFKLNIAAFLFDGLRRADFFGNEPKSEMFKNFSNIELFIGFLLFHNVSVADQYSGAVEMEFVGLKLEPTRASVGVGKGIASFQSLMNHSCDANTFTLINKRRMLSYSLRPIKAGEQIFTTYAYSYFTYPKQGRALLFKENFKMECQCIACIENWPTLEELIERKDIYLTSSNKKKIKKMKETSVWLMSTLSVLCIPSTADMIVFGQNNLKKALEFNSEIRRYVKEPSPSACIGQSFIQTLVSRRAGNTNITPSTAQILEDFVGLS